MSTIDPDTLLPNEHVQRTVIDGDVTQISRGSRYADEGDTFELDGETFELTTVEERTLGDFTDEDARREGSTDLESYRERLVRVHGGDFEWDDSSEVVTYRFERQ